jgi:hypothetical protein
MSEAEKEIVGFIRGWQERHDLRPSEVVTVLETCIETIKPSKGK